MKKVLVCLITLMSLFASKAWALDYTAVVTNVSISQLNSITKNQFTVTITQDGYRSSNSSWYRGSTATLILESNDRSLEGTYKSTNGANNNKINANSQAAYGSNTGRMLRSDQESKITITKTSEGNYAISSSNGWLGFEKGNTTYNYTYCYYFTNVAKTEYALGNFSFSYTPESYCAAPTGLTRSDLTFSWTSSASSFQYCCLPSNITSLTDEIWIANRHTTSSKSVTPEGLEPGGSYKFHVLAEGPGGTSKIVSSSTFTVPCDIKTAPWSDNFDRDAMMSNYTPNCWGQIAASGASVKVASSNSHSSSKCVQIHGGYTSEVTAILPEFEDDIKDLALSFWYKSAVNNQATYGRLQPGYVKDNVFYPVGNALEQTASYVHVEDFVINDAPEGAYFALQFTGGTSIGNAYIDDIEVSSKPASVRPTKLDFEYITDESAAITWNTNGMSAWKVQTSENGETWSEAVSVNTNSYTITGLNANTTYFVRVKGYNGEESVASIMRSFKTYCAGISTLPWTHDFEEDDVNTIPECWREFGYYSESGFTGNMPRVISCSYAYGGSGKSIFSYGGGVYSSTLIILPYFEETISNLAVSFWYNNRYTGNAYGQTEIGYITDPTDPSSFVSLQQLDKVATYTFVDKFPMTGAPDNSLIAIRHAGGSNEYGYSDIDDITVGLIPVCHAPSAITASNITNSGATISWTAENGETAWLMQYSTDSENWTDVNDGNAIDNNPYTLTGLSNANSQYYVRVMALCGGDAGESSWSSPISFITDCDAITVNATSPWDEDFNTMSAEIIPECWDNSASTAIPHNSYSYYIWGTYNAGSGNKMLRMSNASVDGGIALINTPAFTLPNDANDYEFTFDYANRASSGNLLVKVSVDGGAFSQVGSYSNAGGTYSATNPGEMTSAVISLSSYKGHTVKLQFYTTPAAGTNNNDGAIFADNVSVHKVPSCFQPTALAASNITVNSAHLTWTAGGEETAWRLQYRANAGEWSEDITVNTTAAKDLESLSAHTTYEVRVKAWCNIDDFSEWSETASFTTLCAAESMPYSESFGLTTSLPTCWKASSNNWSGDYQSTNGFARLRTGSSGTASLCTPPVDLSEDAILRFKWKNANGTAVNLYISTDRGETKTLISEELYGVQADWATKQYNLSAYTGEEAQFYFIATFSTQNQYAYLDDVEVFAIPTEVFLDNVSATDNEDRLEDLMGQIANITINRPLLRNGDYCTLTLPFNLSAEQIADENCPLHGFTIKEFESSESGDAVNIYLTEVSEIEAGKPYFVRYAGTPTNERLTPLTFRNVTVAAYEPASIALTDDCTPHGVFNPYPLVKDDVSTLFLSSNNTLYYPSANGTMNGFRAYIKVGGAASAPIRHGAPIRIVERENTATGVEEVQRDKVQCTKVIRNGQMIIIRDNKEYNAQGILIR